MVKKYAKADATKQNEYLQDLVAKFVESAPEGWRRLKYVQAATMYVSSIFATVTLEDGVEKRVRGPRGVAISMSRLRSGMYEPLVGTWYTLTVTIEPSGEFSAAYDYDSKPDAMPPFPDSAFISDFEFFPRDREHTPDWLSEILHKEFTPEQLALMHNGEGPEPTFVPAFG
ncbi:hypothetical protein [Nocardia camponoti]|uniref:Uncharacterized protein n=1 Tax=Nocardia camponoti TaxID=1616106 RepID=A0A917V4X3_9NOCA|nr:hypothetical protein [Nocardia camponoti]GGK40276.1 hypothetical protein GCM10011591_09900 [Nocardia camponoti]